MAETSEQSQQNQQTQPNTPQVNPSSFYDAEAAWVESQVGYVGGHIVPSNIGVAAKFLAAGMHPADVVKLFGYW